MSIFVHSDDFKSGGSTSDGVWEFTRNLKGNWAVIGQHMDTQSFPWMWGVNNTMVMRIKNPEEPLEYTVFEIDFDTSIGTLSDINSIATNMSDTMQAAIDLVAIDDPYAARLVSFTADSTTINFRFDDDPVDILWQGWEVGVELGANFISTVNVPLGKTSATADENNIQDLTISTHNMSVDPKYLEVYISESNTQISTSHGTLPTLLFSTRDGEFDGQSFSIPTDTQELTIQIKRMSDELIIPLTAPWYLIFQNAS